MEKVVAVANSLSAVFILAAALFLESQAFVWLIMISVFWLAMARPAIKTIIDNTTSGDTRRTAFSASYMAATIAIPSALVGPD